MVPSRRELIRSLVRSGGITGDNLGTHVTVETVAYGAQRRRAGMPLRRTTGQVMQGPRLTHDESYDGPYDPNSPPPSGGVRGRLGRQPRRRVKGTRRLRMFFLGKRSATDAPHTFLKLRRKLDGGEGLKESTLQAKLRKSYRSGIAESDLRSADGW